MREESCFFEGDFLVLGPSRIGEGSRIGLNSIVGYPRRSKFRGLEPAPTERYVELLDGLSGGSMIGKECTLRSGTTVYEGAVLGDRVATGHNALIREDSSIGQGSLIGSGTQLDGKVSVGEMCSIQSLVYLPGMTKVGSNVFIGPGVVVTNDRYPPSRKLAGVTIGDGCIIGANSTIIAPLVISEGAVVAAGSVVTKDVPRGHVVKGVPAAFHCKREQYDEKKRAYEMLP
ncbi:MAG: N-acetyltransferase [Candidatus Brockarchaeota archaeon]|nr:N-acetyltransferase [Candidatus Brockarchaeota archaeon]